MKSIPFCFTEQAVFQFLESVTFIRSRKLYRFTSSYFGYIYKAIYRRLTKVVVNYWLYEGIWLKCRKKEKKRFVFTHKFFGYLLYQIRVLDICCKSTEQQDTHHENWLDQCWSVMIMELLSWWNSVPSSQ